MLSTFSRVPVAAIPPPPPPPPPAEKPPSADSGGGAASAGAPPAPAADLDTEAAFRATRRRAPAASFAGPERFPGGLSLSVTVRSSQGDILILQPSFDLVEPRVRGGGAAAWGAPPPANQGGVALLKGAAGQLTSPRALDAARPARPAWSFSSLARMGVPADPARAAEAAERERARRAEEAAEAAAGGATVVRVDPWVALAATRIAFPGALDFRLLTGREPARPRRHGPNEAAVGRYDVAAALALLAKHVPAPLWAAQGDRWSGFGANGVSKEAALLGRRQQALDLAAAVAATRPAPPAWTFSPAITVAQRLGAQTDGRPPLEVSFALVRRRSPGPLPFAPPRNARALRALRAAVAAAVGLYRRAAESARSPRSSVAAL